MRINELKIGDKIKFQLPNCIPIQGKLEKIYSDSFIIDGIHVSEKYVISKIEKIDIPPFSLQFREISIEKEKRSFKFNIRITEFSQDSNWYRRCTNLIGGFSTDTDTCIEIKNFPAPEWIDFNKEYTIEIKEKE